MPFALKQLTQTDRNGELARPVAAVANWASAETNTITRPLLERIAGVHADAHLPKFNGRTLTMRAKAEPLELNREAPAYGKRKAVLYATCFANYNNPAIGMATRAILARNGVETEVVYPSCCGMPQLEQGDLAAVDAKAATVAQALGPWIDKGYDVIALVPSCALMLKMEWPLIVPKDAAHRAAVDRLAQATFDVSEYIVDLARRDGLAEGLQPLPGGVALHIACHARAQNMGQKAAEMLRLIPKADLKVIERCSGHGGSWGVLTDNFPVALKVGKPVANQALKAGKAFVASECPIAGPHIMQGIDRVKGEDGGSGPEQIHPVELFARAYGITV